MKRSVVTRRELVKLALMASGSMSNMGRSLWADESRNCLQDAHSSPFLPQEQMQSFNDGWRFLRGDINDAMARQFDDGSWRAVDLPHDWSIEDLSPGDGHENPSVVGPFSVKQSAGGFYTGFTVGGTGWYRKKFSLSHLHTGSIVQIVFEGVYMNSDVWLNGTHLGNHPYGYTSFAYDLTKFMDRKSDNVLAVRVRNAGKNSRWYSGSGIYRNVSLSIKPKVHIPLWTTAISTPEVAEHRALVHVNTRIRNTCDKMVRAEILIRLLDDEHVTVATVEQSLQLKPDSHTDVKQAFTISSPALWSPELPAMYTALIQLRSLNGIEDAEALQFGIRRIDIDAERGLRLNGKPMKLRGACLHHDNGVLGSAAIPRAEERRVELLKSAGFNSIRTAHNPPSSAFLDACDRLGMLVVEEAFDQWENGKNPQDYHLWFDDWSARDIESMVRRDRNHPSVILWSIGNEISEKASPQGVAIGNALRLAVKRHDPTRLVTAAVDGTGTGQPGKSWGALSPAFSCLDVGGYNYRLGDYESDHALYPERVMLGTESFPQQVFDNWKAVEKQPWVIGDFVWTGMDYLGEAGLGHTVLNGEPNPLYPGYPWMIANCGDIDLIGDKKPQSYYRDVVWNRSKLEMAVQRPMPEGRTEELSYWGYSDELQSWTWPGSEGKVLKVRVYSSADEVQLYLNDELAGSMRLSAANKLKAEFEVPYRSGKLRAIALRDGKVIGSRSFITVGKPAGLRLTPDRPEILASRADLSFVRAEIIDEQGQLVPDADATVHFKVTGTGELAGAGCANPRLFTSFRQPESRTFKGVCLAVVRPNSLQEGEIRLLAEAERLRSACTVIRTFRCRD